MQNRISTALKLNSPIAPPISSRLTLVPSNQRKAFPTAYYSELHARIERFKEIEIGYFIHTDALTKTTKLAQLYREHLFQSYLPRSHIEEAIELAGVSLQGLSALELAVLKRARLRKVLEFKPGSAQPYSIRHLLQLKTTKEGGIVRTEVTIDIPESRFRRILPLATNGSIEKVRFLKTGSIADRSGVHHQAEAHIDFLISAGRSLSLSSIGSKEIQLPHYALIDIEIPRESLAQRLFMFDSHAFTFLKHAVPINQQKRKIRKRLSARRIAFFGLRDAVFRETVNKLFNIATKR